MKIYFNHIRYFSCVKNTKNKNKMRQITKKREEEFTKLHIKHFLYTSNDILSLLIKEVTLY